MEAACTSREVVAVPDGIERITIIKFDSAAAVDAVLAASSMNTSVLTEAVSQALTGPLNTASEMQTAPGHNDQPEQEEAMPAGGSKAGELPDLTEGLLGVKNEVSIQANDYEIERATGILPARKRFIPLKYRDFRSADEIEKEDDKDSDYEPEPLNQPKEPKKKKGRGRPRKNPEGKSSSDGPNAGKRPMMARTANGYKCLTCNHVFNQKGNLKVHLLTHTDERPWRCDVDNCDKGFRTKESLRRHKLSHMGIKPFECTECKKKFCSAFSLQEHMSLHNNQRPYLCTHCQRAFRQISCLRRHLLTHSSDMPHACHVCGRRFSQAVYLRSHMKVHTGEKPFGCDQCNKSFAHASDLTRHKIIHSGSKPYSCSVCSMRFSDPSSRRRHQREHEGTKSYTCDLCTEGFKRASQLRAHLYRRHGAVKEGVELQIQEGAEPVCYRIELHDPQADGSDASSSGKVVDLSSVDQKKILSLLQTLNHNLVVQEVEVCGESQDLTEASPHVGVGAGHTPQPADMDHLVMPVEVVTPMDKPDDVSQGGVTISEMETSQIVQDLGPDYQILQGVGGRGEGEGQSVYEVHHHPTSSTHLPVSAAAATITTVLSEPVPAQPLSPSAAAAMAVETLAAVDDSIGSASTSNAAHPTPQPSTGDCLNSDFVGRPDFGSQDYYDWLSGFTEVCKVLPVPLEVEVFQKISQVHKSLSDFMASPSGVIADKENFKILMSISKDLSLIQNEHLKCMLQNLSEIN